MCLVNVDVGFYKLDKFGEFIICLVVFIDGIEFISLDNDVEIGELREFVFVFFEIRKVYFFLCMWGVSFFCGVDCILEYVKFE